MSTTNTDAVFKHLKILNKSSTLPEVTTWVERICNDNQHKANLSNEFFLSVFSPKKESNFKEIRRQNPVLLNLSVSRSKMRDLSLI